MISLSLSYSSKFLTYGLLAVSQTRYMGRKAPKQGKPPILPPSKKVLYHVVHVPWQRPDEVKELLWRRHVYNNAVISLREVFRSEMQLKANEGQGLEAMKASEEAELDDLIAENDRINKEKAITRAAREQDEWKKTKLEILKEIEEALEQQRRVTDNATEEVRAAISRSKDFVDRENLELKILSALENPVVYNFVIDRLGNKGYENLPVKYQEGTPTRQKGRLYDNTPNEPQIIEENRQ